MKITRTHAIAAIAEIQVEAGFEPEQILALLKGEARPVSAMTNDELADEYEACTGEAVTVTA